MSTAAAPTFFKPYVCSDGISLIDGGVWSNNPVAVAAAETHYLGWQAEEVRILSLGTTRSRPPPLTQSGAAKMAGKGWVAHMFMDAQSSAALKFARVMTQRQDEKQSIWRIDQEVPHSTFSLDATSEIKRLEGLGRSSARNESAKIIKAFFETPAEPFVPLRQVM